MSDQPETCQRISVPEAAAALGVSVATVRRRIRAGSLQAERVHRPQGITYIVLLSSDHGSNHDRSDSDQQAGITARLKQSPGDALAAWSATVLAPLVATIAEQAETIGQLRAENDALRASQTKQDANPGPLVPAATTNTPVPLLARLRALAPWLLVALAIVVAIVLVVGPQ